MRKIKIFCENNMNMLEVSVNSFLERNPQISIEGVSATDVMVDGECWSTLYVFYLESEHS